MQKPAEQAAPVRGEGLLGTYLSTLALTLTNPATLLSFLGVFAGAGIGSSNDYSKASAMVAGVFAGSAFWWLILSSGVGLLRSKVTPRLMQGINWFSGSFLAAFGIYALLSSIGKAT